MKKNILILATVGALLLLTNCDDVPDPDLIGAWEHTEGRQV